MKTPEVQTIESFTHINDHTTVDMNITPVHGGIKVKRAAATILHQRTNLHIIKCRLTLSPTVLI
jgi:hypothetical protein